MLLEMDILLSMGHVLMTKKRKPLYALQSSTEREYAIVWIIAPFEKVNNCLTFALLNENILVLWL